MSDELARMAQLHLQGFHCSQIIVLLGLERQGRNSPDLVRAMTGLAGGMGFGGKNCGSLTGAVCLIGLYAGRGTLEEQESPRLNVMISELLEWFGERFGKLYGGIDCEVILADDPWNKMLRCPGLVSETYFRAIELLQDNGLMPAEEAAED